MAVAVAKEEMDYTIKPEASAANISTSEWPLLLKNYEQRKCSLGNNLLRRPLLLPFVAFTRRPAY